MKNVTTRSAAEANPEAFNMLKARILSLSALLENARKGGAFMGDTKQLQNIKNVANNIAFDIRSMSSASLRDLFYKMPKSKIQILRDWFTANPTHNALDRLSELEQAKGISNYVNSMNTNDMNKLDIQVGGGKTMADVMAMKNHQRLQEKQ